MHIHRDNTLKPPHTTHLLSSPPSTWGGNQSRVPPPLTARPFRPHTSPSTPPPPPRPPAPQVEAIKAEGPSPELAERVEEARKAYEAANKERMAAENELRRLQVNVGVCVCLGGGGGDAYGVDEWS